MEEKKSIWDKEWDVTIQAEDINRLFKDDLYHYTTAELYQYGSSDIAVKFKIEYPLGRMLQHLSLWEKIVITEEADYGLDVYGQYLELSKAALDELEEKMGVLEKKLIPLLKKFKEDYNK